VDSNIAILVIGEQLYCYLNLLPDNHGLIWIPSHGDNGPGQYACAGMTILALNHRGRTFILPLIYEQLKLDDLLTVSQFLD